MYAEGAPALSHASRGYTSAIHAAELLEHCCVGAGLVAQLTHPQQPAPGASW